jgi:Delta14-sterol reductase
VSGCPAPALLEPRTLTWDKLKSQIPWPEEGIQGFVSWNATFWVIAYYVLSLFLGRVLPAQEVYGMKLREFDRPLKYQFNCEVFLHALVPPLNCFEIIREGHY